MAYLVLARKYRSATFDEVVGQEAIRRTLVNAIKTGRIAHAYLFTGTRGVGKTTVARIMAKALNCLSADEPTPEPCNRCDACVRISRGEDVDVVEIDGASNRGIDEIRELRANAIFRPARCRYKVYYIDEVHQITRDAFNALLKTLEEPPGHVKFLFSTTEVEKVPATILSRCQRFDFRNIPTRLIAEHLQTICKAEKVEADGDALFRIARAGAGSIRDALSLLDQLLAAGGARVSDQEVIRLLGAPAEERTLAIARAIADGDAAAALTELNGVLESGVGLASATAALGDVFRNMMLAATCGADSDLIELPDAPRAETAELAGMFSTPALVHAVGVLQAAGRNIRGSSAARALVEAALVRLAEADKFVDAASLAEKLDSLAAGAPGPAQKKNAEAPGALTGDAARGRYSASASSSSSSPSPSSPAPRVTTPDPPTALGGTALGGTASGGTAPGGTAPDGTAPGGTTSGGTASGGTVSGGTQSPRTAVRGSAAIRWDASWLSSNWRRLIDALADRRHMQVAGALRPAKVLAFEGDVLKLGYDSDHEVIRKRCAGSQAKAVDSALTDLAGRQIRCEYVSTGEPPKGRAPARPVFGTLSTAEKNEISNDPAVKEVLGLFGGEVVDVRKDASRGRPAADSESTQRTNDVR